jgi:class 3 adenylate cyclase
VVAGVVGRTKFSFDLWGDTVNVAARLSALGGEDAVYLSADAVKRVHNRCRVLNIGTVQLKGRGDHEVYRFEEVIGQP